MGIEPFKSYDCFDQADRARRDAPDPINRVRTQRWRDKANELRALARNCAQEDLRATFSDLAETYDRLANASEEPGNGTVYASAAR